jgi:hypothetical protein
VDCIQLAQDREKSWTAVSMVKNSLDPKIWGISWIAEWLLASLRGFCFMLKRFSFLYYKQGISFDGPFGMENVLISFIISVCVLAYKNSRTTRNIL